MDSVLLLRKEGAQCKNLDTALLLREGKAYPKYDSAFLLRVEEAGPKMRKILALKGRKSLCQKKEGAYLKFAELALKRGGSLSKIWTAPCS